jgi:multicomponent Na+:H+ antiporter subunit D
MILVAPLLLPLLTALLLLGLHTRPRLQRQASVLSAALQAGVAGILLARTHGGDVLTLAVGNWPPPFGIEFAGDIFGSLMVGVSCLISLAVSVYTFMDEEEGELPVRMPVLQHALLAGVNAAFLTGDLFNLYVWFEVLLISSFALLVLGGGRGRLEGAVKYVLLNLLSSVLFLTATGILYGIAGTLNMADLAVRLRTGPPHPLLPLVGGMFLLGFGIKAALFPLFGWLPASYHTLPPGVGALFAGLLTKVGVYALYRMFVTILPQDGMMQGILLVLSACTMAVGVLGAAVQMEVRRLLSFHIVSQIGYLLFALALGTPAAIAGGIFYTVHHIVVKSNLFLVAGLLRARGGSFHLRALGDLAGSAPVLGALFLVPALSLAGIPPLSGFWAKLLVIRAGLDAGSIVVTGVALAVGLLTLFSMTKVWAEAFWKRPPAGPPHPAPGGTAPRVMFLAVALLACVTLIIGFLPDLLLGPSLTAAHQLLPPQGVAP